MKTSHKIGGTTLAVIGVGHHLYTMAVNPTDPAADAPPTAALVAVTSAGDTGPTIVIDPTTDQEYFVNWPSIGAEIKQRDGA